MAFWQQGVLPVEALDMVGSSSRSRPAAMCGQFIRVILQRTCTMASIDKMLRLLSLASRTAKWRCTRSFRHNEILLGSSACTAQGLSCVKS